MILKDDKETTVDYFSKFPSNIENIGLSLSGGMDSALILWCLVEMLRGREAYWRKDVKIWCTAWIRHSLEPESALIRNSSKRLI